MRKEAPAVEEAAAQRGTREVSLPLCCHRRPGPSHSGAEGTARSPHSGPTYMFSETGHHITERTKNQSRTQNAWSVGGNIEEHINNCENDEECLSLSLPMLVSVQVPSVLPEQCGHQLLQAARVATEHGKCPHNVLVRCPLAITSIATTPTAGHQV